MSGYTIVAINCPVIITIINRHPPPPSPRGAHHDLSFNRGLPNLSSWRGSVRPSLSRGFGRDDAPEVVHYTLVQTIVGSYDSCEMGETEVYSQELTVACFCGGGFSLSVGVRRDS